MQKKSFFKLYARAKRRVAAAHVCLDMHVYRGVVVVGRRRRNKILNERFSQRHNFRAYTIKKNNIKIE